MRKGMGALVLALLLALALPAGRLAAAEGYEAKTWDLGGDLERVKLRAKAGTDARVLGQYFEGVIVTVLDEGGTWCRVRIGDAEGYMMRKFLTREISDFDRISEGMSGMVRYPQADGTLPLHARPDGASPVLARLPRGYVDVLGTVDDSWLHVAREIDGQRVYGYASALDITNTDNLAAFSVDTGDPAQKQNLRDKPAKDGRVIGQYFSGATVYWLFDNHVNGDGWQKVRIGDAAGYMMDGGLDGSTGGEHRFKPPLTRAVRDGIPLYEGWADAQPTGTAGRVDVMLVLGTRGERYYVGIETEEPYMYAYGYVDKADVQPVTRAARATGTLRSEQTLYRWGEDGRLEPIVDVIGAKGAWAYIDASVSADGARETADYIDPALPWLRCTVEAEPNHYVVGCLVPLEAVDYDAALEYPGARP